MIGAAIIDDIIALLLFSLVLGYVEEEEAAEANQIEEMVLILVSIASFFIIMVILDQVFRKRITPKLRDHSDRYLVLSITLILIFFLAWLAGTLYLAPIIGAFMSGVIIGRDKELSERSHGQILPIARWLVPFFFIAVGLRIDLSLITNITAIGLALLLSAFAILSKIIGSGIGALIHDKTNNVVDAIEVGTGMAPRGEVTLLIATAALDLGVFSEFLYAIIVVTVAVSAIVVPMIMRYIVNLPSNISE
jgi:Kef-type K+ transport system membrane component KefB